MSTAVCCIDIIGIAQNIFVIAVRILHGNFHFIGIFCHFKVDDFLMNRILVSVEEFRVFFQTAFIMIGFILFLTFPFILECDLDSLIEERHFPQTVLQSMEIKNGCFENFRIRPESGLRSGLL